jgi:hypothetical protein
MKTRLRKTFISTDAVFSAKYRGIAMPIMPGRF